MRNAIFRHAAGATLLLGAVLCAYAAPKPADKGKKLYCWDEGGRKVCGDALPASAAAAARTEISAKSGRTLDTVGRALTPDERALDRLKGLGFPVMRLARTTDTHLLRSDPWTAIVFLFHDHDWEVALLRRAFELPHFYIGAMGGRRAHAVRCEALRAAGVPASAIATLHAPIGLFHSSRDPDTLALSTLAEIVQTYQAADFGPALG